MAHLVQVLERRRVLARVLEQILGHKQVLALAQAHRQVLAQVLAGVRSVLEEQERPAGGLPLAPA